MRRLFLVILLILSAFGPSLAQAEDKPYKIAILEFDNLSEAATKENLGRLLSEFLITAAVNSGTFNVVERAALKKVLDEMQFGAGSKSPGTAAQAIGAMVGARGVLTGSVVKSDGSVRLDARLVDVASGSIVAARSAYAKDDMRSLSTAAELLVNQLEGDLAKLPPSDAPPAPASSTAPAAPEKQQEGNSPQQSAQ